MSLPNEKQRQDFQKMDPVFDGDAVDTLHIGSPGTANSCAQRAKNVSNPAGLVSMSIRLGASPVFSKV